MPAPAAGRADRRQEGAHGAHRIFPASTDRRGRRRTVVRPPDDRARRVIEGAVLEALGHPLEKGGAA